MTYFLKDYQGGFEDLQILIETSNAYHCVSSDGDPSKFLQS